MAINYLSPASLFGDTCPEACVNITECVPTVFTHVLGQVRTRRLLDHCIVHNRNRDQQLQSRSATAAGAHLTFILFGFCCCCGSDAVPG